jgi:hypothetical protein
MHTLAHSHTSHSPSSSPTPPPPKKTQVQAAIKKDWKPILDSATAKFRAAGAAEADIRAALKNHSMVGAGAGLNRKGSLILGHLGVGREVQGLEPLRCPSGMFRSLYVLAAGFGP